MTSDLSPVDRSGEFSIMQIARMDARWLREQLGCTWAATTIDGLLEHIEQLQQERDEEVEERVAEAMEESLRLDLEQLAEIQRLRAQRQAALRICDEVWSDPFQCGRVRTALGVDHG